MLEPELSTKEMEVFLDNGDEINDHLYRIFMAFENGDPGKAGEELAEFSIFCFKMGRDNANV